MGNESENLADDDLGDLGDRGRAAISGHTGDEPSARALLASTDPAVRATALGALARMNRLTDADLTAALADETSTVRHRAVALAADRRAIALVPLLADGDPAVAEQAAWACGERQPAEEGAVTALSVLAVEHDDALVREAAVAALGAIGDPAGLAAILGATTDKPAVRRRAVLALAPFAGPEVDAALQRALTDRDWQVRQAAEDLLPGRQA
jgi:HEAT repeat protein